MKRWIAGALVASLLLACGVSVVRAQGGVTFPSDEVLARAIDERPDKVIRALKIALTQEEADQFYAYMVPPPSVEDKIRELRHALRAAMQADELILAARIRNRIEELSNTARAAEVE